MITPEMYDNLKVENTRLRAALADLKIEIEGLKHALSVMTADRDTMSDALAGAFKAETETTMSTAGKRAG